VSAGLGHGFRRAVEHGVPRKVQTIDYSNFTFALSLKAAAQGVPFLPSRSVLGSDLQRTNPDIQPIGSPFGDDRLVAVRAFTPDVAFVSVQRADAEGGAHCWGAMGVSQEACLAARDVVLLAEEIVEPDVIASDPNRILTPAFRVSAVVHEPFGCHPSPVQGYYGRDHAAYHDYHAATRTAHGAEAWLDEWVHGVTDRAGYLAKLGAERLAGIAVRERRLAAAVDYGY
jgi:glutaconate CoA-transferase subunit A